MPDKSFFSNKFRTITSAALHLVYPSICCLCDNELVENENNICSICSSDLEFTYFENYTEPSELDQLFWGRVPLQFAYSLLYYSKEKPIKNILSALKYKHRKDVGFEFGKLIAKKIEGKSALKDLECLVPVPIHPQKAFIRGYNQSELIAQGINEILNIPVRTNLLTRNENSKSQTRLGRFKRWENVSEKFSVSDRLQEYKHIALIDDVITTGSTLESIIKKILEINPSVKISLISLALAK